jgi:hypothetical protein
LFIWAAENLFFWAAAFVNWAAKLGGRFYFFGQQFYFFRTAKFINGQQLLAH